jgi:hypothetical protein
MSRRRRLGEPIAAFALAAVAVLTIVWPEWIEGIFGLDPDAGSGAAEAVVVMACALGAGAFGARSSRRSGVRRRLGARVRSWLSRLPT